MPSPSPLALPPSKSARGWHGKRPMQVHNSDEDHTRSPRCAAHETVGSPASEILLVLPVPGLQLQIGSVGLARRSR